MLCSGAKRRHAEGRRWVACSRDMDMDMNMNILRKAGRNQQDVG